MSKRVSTSGTSCPLPKDDSTTLPTIPSISPAEENSERTRRCQRSSTEIPILQISGFMDNVAR